MKRSAIAIGLTRTRFCAVLGALGDGALRIERLIVAELPEDLPRDDAAGIGAWIGEQLRLHGFPRGKVTVALTREAFGLKRMTLPTVDPVELPDMTRLAMQRELPFDASDAVIDYLPVAADESTTTVIAVAVPRPLMTITEQVLAAAGRTPERVSLRALGAAALAGTVGADPSASTLTIDITGGSVEFSVIIDGLVRFSRAADLAPGIDDDQLVEAVATETRRTWMSYRIVEAAEDVRRVLVLGSTDVAGRAAAAVGKVLGVPAEGLDYHPLVQDEGHELGRAWPLAGLLLESARGVPSIDFAHPRRAPDPGAGRRRVALVAVGAVVLLWAAAYMLGTVRGKRLEQTARALASQYQQMIPGRIRYKRDGFRLTHLEQWQRVEADWLEHLDALASLLPPREQLVLDDWSGALDFRGVRYESRPGDPAEWSAPRTIRITVEGEARDREIADALRAALVDGELYRANTPAPDAAGGRRLPFAFTYQLQTERSRPDAAADGAAGAAADAAAEPAGSGAAGGAEP